MQKFVNKIISSRKRNIFELHEKADGKDVYYFLLVHQHKLSSFLNIKPGQKYKITDYGHVVEWGFGNVPQSVRELVKTKYKISS